VARGICYGQTDLDVTESFRSEADIIRQSIPADANIRSVHSSPLLRCAVLARHLFPSHPVSYHEDLMEVHCGQWEMKTWDELPKEEIDPWMADFVNCRIPGGESYVDLHDRVSRRFELIKADLLSSDLYAGPSSVIISHGGPIRSILAGITGTRLADSFKKFPLHYGCVVRLFTVAGPAAFSPDNLQFEMLSNPAPIEREQHKPSSFYK
jgi:alpha-ribazole phosphatase